MTFANEIAKNVRNYMQENPIFNGKRNNGTDTESDSCARVVEWNNKAIFIRALNNQSKGVSHNGGTPFDFANERNQIRSRTVRTSSLIRGL